jgi:hypothetical protein
LPLRNGRRPASCPTCGAAQTQERKAPLSRRIPTHPFYGANLVGLIVGGILGLLLGAFFAALIYRDKDPRTLLLLVPLYSLGFAFLGCAFGFAAVARATRER